MKYEIKKHVPLMKGHRLQKYPFHEMEVGDMFEVGPEEANAARGASFSHGRNHQVKFKSQKLENGNVGIWRVK